MLGLIAVAAYFSNMVGGFIITDRMLSMFKTGKAAKSHEPSRPPAIVKLTYIAAAMRFILAIKWLGSPVTAKRGVVVGEIASAPVIATLYNPQVTQLK